MHIWDIVLTIIVALALFFVWIILLDTNRFVIRREKITDSRIKKGLRTVVLSDLHNKSYGKNNVRLLEAIRKENPDVILIAGDMMNAIPKAKFDVPVALLQTLAQEYPIYYGIGNHEHRIKLYPEKYGDMAQRYAKALEKIGIEPMVNCKREIPDTGIVVYGSEIAREFYKRTSKTTMEPDYMATLLGEPNPGEYTVLLAHLPNYFPEYAAWGADLVLSGHNHGGIARVPFWGKGVISSDLRLFPKYDGGVLLEKNSKMILSRGLGVHTIPIRVFNPGEIWVVEFEGDSDSET